ncbi:hypothetical protein C0J45_6303 [Silurus meridionalis]|nr:hypothetical protein C0J45_6303 [Silurus meridionalis]
MKPNVQLGQDNDVQKDCSEVAEMDPGCIRTNLQEKDDLLKKMQEDQEEIEKRMSQRQMNIMRLQALIKQRKEEKTRLCGKTQRAISDPTKEQEKRGGAIQTLSEDSEKRSLKYTQTEENDLEEHKARMIQVDKEKLVMQIGNVVATFMFDQKHQTKEQARLENERMNAELEEEGGESEVSWEEKCSMMLNQWQKKDHALKKMLEEKQAMLRKLHEREKKKKTQQKDFEMKAANSLQTDAEELKKQLKDKQLSKLTLNQQIVAKIQSLNEAQAQAREAMKKQVCTDEEACTEEEQQYCLKIQELNGKNSDLLQHMDELQAYISHLEERENEAEMARLVLEKDEERWIEEREEMQREKSCWDLEMVKWKEDREIWAEDVRMPVRMREKPGRKRNGQGSSVERVLL